MAAARVLIVEDDADINTVLTTHLTRCGYACTQAFSGSEAKMLLLGEGTGTNGRLQIPFDIVICDLMLPGATGEELIQLIREHDGSLPVIVTSARTATNDKVDLLKLGADDYLAKPFDLDELTVRIEVQLRHRGLGAGKDASPVLRFRDWELDPEARTFTAAGHAVTFTRIEFNIVEALMRQPKRAWSKQDLFEAAWGEPYAADDNTVTAHMSNIRTKLRPSGTDAYIKTVWGMGFRLAE